MSLSHNNYWVNRVLGWRSFSSWQIADASQRAVCLGRSSACWRLLSAKRRRHTGSLDVQRSVSARLIDCWTGQRLIALSGPWQLDADRAACFHLTLCYQQRAASSQLTLSWRQLNLDDCRPYQCIWRPNDVIVVTSLIAVTSRIQI